MSAFADTSALYALMVRTDDSHHRVRDAFARLVSSERPLWTTSFVVVETMALLQHRLGLDAAHDFDAELLPALRVGWVDEELYRLGTARLWQMNRRDLSLVDCVSFEFMKRHGLHVAFAVDPDFQEAGFDVVPKRR
jgi:predicted nucleic acid-binding protein